MGMRNTLGMCGESGASLKDRKGISYYSNKSNGKYFLIKISTQNR